MDNLKIAYLTEGNWTGKVPRNHPNMRNDVANMHVFNADHIPLFGGPWKGQEYDLAIVVLPKKNISKLMNNDWFVALRPMCKKIAFMQEGPNWFWQDYTMEEQIWYFNTLSSADFLLAHNEADKNYYEGLTGLRTYVLPTLMITDYVANLPEIQRKDVMIGGNMTSWYGGFDSMIVAQEFGEQIYAPSMGRKIAREDELDITHLPYMNWIEWVTKLNEFKYGVHLMRTHAAGTFALNTSFLQIPTIGYDGLDTQQILHPYTTIQLGDLHTAKQIARKLKNDSNFYDKCATETKSLYEEHYTESVFLEKMNKIFEKEL